MKIYLNIMAVICLGMAVAVFPANAEQAGFPLVVNKINVITTNSILGDWVRSVGRDRVEVNDLVGPNGDAHTFEPIPQHSIMLKEAKVIIRFDLGFEPWLDGLYKSSASKAHRYTVSDGVNFIHLVKPEGMFREEVDPHIWHDPVNAVRVIQNITTALINEDPSHAQEYWANARQYTDELLKLDALITKEVRKIPEERRKIVTSHDTFGYFARRYGFKVIGTVIHSATTESADPSAKEMAELVNLIKASGVSAIFLENVNNPKVAESIAKEANIKIAPKLYSDALGESGSPAATYIEMMKYNVKVFVDHLRK